MTATIRAAITRTEIQHRTQTLANDIDKLLANSGHQLDDQASEVLAAFPGVVAKLAEDLADDDWETSGDAAAWGPQSNKPEAVIPAPNTGRLPRMTYLPWRKTQGVDIGSTDVHAVYWRCPACKVHAGPFASLVDAKREGMDHRYREHDLPAARAAEARKAARHAAR